MEHINFRITEVSRIIARRHPEGWHLETLYPHNFVLVIVLDGQTEYQIQGESFTVNKNDVLLFPPGIRRTAQTSRQAPWSFISILFHMDVLQDSLHMLNKPYIIWKDMADPVRPLFKEASDSWTGKNVLFQIKCNYLITEILYKLFLSAMPYHQVPHISKIEKARSYIQEHFREEISIRSLADSLDMSVSYFRRLFHDAYGYSPMQYITNLRIENARDLLLSGEVNVTEAAELSGFDDIYYFSTLFKRKTGTSPGRLLREK